MESFSSVADIVGPFSVSVYKRRVENGGHNSTFYYTPALFLDQHSPRTVFNRFNNRYELTFDVFLQTPEYQQIVRTDLRRRFGISSDQLFIQIIPFKWVRISSDQMSENLTLLNNWTPCTAN